MISSLQLLRGFLTAPSFPSPPSALCDLTSMEQELHHSVINYVLWIIDGGIRSLSIANQARSDNYEEFLRTSDEC